MADGAGAGGGGGGGGAGGNWDPCECIWNHANSMARLLNYVSIKTIRTNNNRYRLSIVLKVTQNNIIHRVDIYNFILLEDTYFIFT